MKPSQTAIDVCQTVLDREQVGRAKYGTTCDRDDQTPAQWLQHLTEEHADALMYAARLKRSLAEMVRKAYEAGHADRGAGLAVNVRIEELTRRLLG